MVRRLPLFLNKRWTKNQHHSRHSIGDTTMNRKTKLVAMAAFAAVITLPTLACGQSSANTTTPATSKTIAQVAIDAGNFTTLVAALQAADLVTTLQGPGPFTVFAPTDA